MVVDCQDGFAIRSEIEDEDDGCFKNKETSLKMPLFIFNYELAITVKQQIFETNASVTDCDTV